MSIVLKPQVLLKARGTDNPNDYVLVEELMDSASMQQEEPTLIPTHMSCMSVNSAGL